MFDDPKRELQWLEEELLAAEEEELGQQEQEEDEDDFAEWDDGGDADWLEEVEELLTQQTPATRKRAGGRGGKPENPAVDFGRTVYDDEEMDEDAAVFDDTPKPKGIGGLVVLAILEVIGILGIALWWLRWLG